MYSYRKNYLINLSKAFTLIELLVVISVVGILSLVIITSLNSAKEKARDARRLQDIRQIQNALDMYYSDHGRYPSPNSDSPACGGWDTTGDGSFIVELVSKSYLTSHILDPVYNTSCTGYYYYRYNVSYGSTAPFYVLAIKNLEGVVGVSSNSPGWSLSGRNWQVEFEWVTGKLE